MSCWKLACWSKHVCDAVILTSHWSSVVQKQDDRDTIHPVIRHCVITMIQQLDSYFKVEKLQDAASNHTRSGLQICPLYFLSLGTWGSTLKVQWFWIMAACTVWVCIDWFISRLLLVDGGGVKLSEKSRSPLEVDCNEAAAPALNTAAHLPSEKLPVLFFFL